MLGKTERKLKKTENKSERSVCDVCGQHHSTESCLFISSCPHSVEDAVTPSRARLTLPANLAVKDLTDGTTTVVTKTKMERGTRFGPFVAPLTSVLPPEVNFPLKIFAEAEEDSYYLDTRSEHDCNWMSLVAPAASSSKEQNLFCYQVHDKLYFSLLCDIEAGEELRVWYAPFYGVKMDISLGRFASLSLTTKSEVSENLTQVEEPETWEADTTTADIPPTEEEPRIISTRQLKNKKQENANETQHQRERDEKARAEYVAQQLPPKCLGARFTPACWRCRECGAKEDSVISYAHHLMQHLKPPAVQVKKFHCSICHQRFCSQQLLDDHEASSHSLPMPQVPATKPVETSTETDDTSPLQECSEKAAQLKTVESMPNIFEKSNDSYDEHQKSPESQVLLSGACVQHPCDVESCPRETASSKDVSALDQGLSLSSSSVFGNSPAAQHDLRTNLSEGDSIVVKSPAISQEKTGKLDESCRKLVAVMGEKTTLQNLLIPIDQQKNIDSLLQTFQQPTREKVTLNPVKVPETILNHDFFTRVAGDTVVRDVKSLLSMGYSLQFLVENEDGSSSLVDVLSTGNCVNRDQVTSTSSVSPNGEISSRQLVVMANGSVPDSLPLALQNILPPSFPIVPSTVDPIITPPTSSLLVEASAGASEADERMNDVQLSSCLSSEQSFLNKQNSISDMKSPLGTLLPSAITNNMCYDSVIPFTDSNSENTSLMEMSLGTENLEREELDYELGALGLPLAVEDTNSTDYMMNTCTTPPPNTNRSNKLCIDANSDLNTPVKLLDQCIGGSLSADVMAFDFAVTSEEPPARILSNPQSDEKSNECRDELPKDFSDLIAADADSSNVMLSIQPADSTAEVRKDDVPAMVGKNNSSVSLEWIGGERLLLSEQHNPVEHDPASIVLSVPEQSSPVESHCQPTTKERDVLLKDRNSEDSGLLQVTTSEIRAELDGLLLNAHGACLSEQQGPQGNFQPQLQMHSQPQPQFQQTLPAQEFSQTEHQQLHHGHAVAIPTLTQYQSHSQPQSQPQTEAQVQDQLQTGSTLDHVPAHEQPISDDQQDLQESRVLVVAEETETEVEKSFISSGPPYICDICNKSFGKVAYLYRHLRKHTGEFTCVACCGVFARKESLQLHECAAQPITQGNASDRLICPFCQKQFAEKKQLTRHITKHAGSLRSQFSGCNNFTAEEATECSNDPSSPEQPPQSKLESVSYQSLRPLRCDLCRRMFLSDAALHRHKWTCQKNFPSPECKYCRRRMAFASPEREEKHMRICAPAVALQAGKAESAVCPECNEPFRQLLLYRQHIYRHTHPFACVHCQRAFCSLQERGKHVCLDRLEQCCQCGQQFGTVTQLERHALAHGVPNFHCFECGRSFHQMDLFSQHRCFELRVKTVRRTTSKRDVSSKELSTTSLVSSSSMKKSTRQGQKPEPGDMFMCETCGEVCKSKRSLKTHRLSHGERKMECVVCGKRFHRKDVLVEHMYVHEEAQLRCSICNKFLKSKKSLEVHMRHQHSGQMQFICQKCGKGFHQMANLKKHMRSHDPRPQPVNCPHCKHRFYFPEELAKHIAQHLEEPLFHCTQCDASFVKEQLLRQHTKVHTSRGFSCPVCGHTLKHRYSLRRHVRKHHPELSLERKSTPENQLEFPSITEQPQSPEVLLTVSELQLTTDGVQQIALPVAGEVENTQCLLGEEAMECAEDMVLYVLQEPLACLPLQEPST